MFTGLIQKKSPIVQIAFRPGGLLLEIAKPVEWTDLELGESISVNGVCLTLTAFDPKKIEFFVGEETLSKSTFAKIKSGHTANLERSLCVGDRLGGHMVSGHADGVARVKTVEAVGDCLRLHFQVTDQQFKWIIPKGSIALNGVSLTVNSVERDDHTVDVFLIPETLARTNLAGLAPGDEVNVECDQTVKIIAHQISLQGVRHEQHS